MSTFCRYLSPLALWSRKSTVVEELVPCRRLTQFPSDALLPRDFWPPSWPHSHSQCSLQASTWLHFACGQPLSSFSLPPPLCACTLSCVRAHKQLFMHKKLKCKEYLAYPLSRPHSPLQGHAGYDKALKMSWHKFWSAASSRGYNEAATNCVKQLKRRPNRETAAHQVEPFLV